MRILWPASCRQERRQEVIRKWLDRYLTNSPEFAVEDGVRLYAIGDIHGRFDLLQKLYDMICLDHASRPAERSIEIFLGDYVDRGPQTKDVLDWLQSSNTVCDERICLRGNHEEILLNYLS